MAQIGKDTELIADMRTQHLWFGFFCTVGLALVGAGCSLPSLLTPQSASTTSTAAQPSGPQPAVFDGLSPQDAANKIQLTAGNALIMKQGFGGVGNKIADLFNVGGPEGERDIVISAFAPANTASLQWKLTTTSDKTTKQTTGNIDSIDLFHSHTLYLPGYWREGDQKALGTSALWLSQDVYEDLVKLHNSSIDFGLFAPQLVDSLPKDVDLQAAIKRMKDAAVAAGNKVDVYYMVADPDQTTKKLIVNGKEVTVQVITARNWFGEIVVLANKQNPLVLQVTLNPLALAAVDSMSGSSYLSHAMGYDITEIKDIQQ